MARIEKTVTSASRNVEKLELSYIAKNVKCADAVGKFGSSSNH